MKTLKTSINESIDKKYVDKVLKYTNDKLKNWYKNAKTDHNVDGSGKATYDSKSDEIVIDYVENGKKKNSKIFLNSEEKESLDYVYNIWMEER